MVFQYLGSLHYSLSLLAMALCLCKFYINCLQTCVQSYVITNVSALYFLQIVQLWDFSLLEKQNLY